ALVEGQETFGTLLLRLGLKLDALDFEPAGRWVTPPFMPVRFDARFFLVEVPPGTRAEVWAGEAAEGSWVRPMDALTLWQGGRGLLPPPHVPPTHTMAWILGTGELLIVAPGAAEPAELDRLAAFVQALSTDDCR